MTPSPTTDAWPPLPLAEWQDAYATLHMWTQIVGKTALAFAPPQNHWWHIAFQVTARGLATGPLPVGKRTFDVAFDFTEHQLVVRTSEDETRSMPLAARAVADFYREYMAMLAELRIHPNLRPVPVEVAVAIPFPDDREHRAYAPDAANRCWRILARADQVLKRFRNRFLGKSSPVHFFWGGFDLACTRFSGRPAPQHRGGVPNCPNWVMYEAYSHECASAGFWPGGGAIAEPAFYAYAYPEPPAFAAAPVSKPGFYSRELGEFILPYDAMRQAAQPEDVLLEFLESTYGAAADLGHWDRRALERPSAALTPG